MAEYITKNQVIEWFRPYGHTEEGIPFDVLETDIAGMATVAAAPVSALRTLRDELYENDLISMEGLRQLNALIATHEGGDDDG